MVSKARSQRIAQRIQEDLAELIQREINDPRLHSLTITGVDVDRELAYATVYVSTLDAVDQKGEVLRALRGARGFLRRSLAARIPLRAFPQLRFRWDPTPARGARIDELLRGLHTGGDREGEQD